MTSRPPSTRRARLRRPGELWGRRSVAIGALLIGAALIGAIVLLIVGGGGDSGSKTSTQISELQNRFLQHTIVVPDKGISVRRPADWTDSQRSGVISVQSHDRCLAMTLSAPAPAGQSNSLRSNSVRLLRRSYKGATVGTAPSSQVGGIPTVSNTISFTDPKGNDIKTLVSVGSGSKYTYLTEIVVRSQSCQGDLSLAQLVLSSVQYTK
jgi:hypothetical protein